MRGLLLVWGLAMTLTLTDCRRYDIDPCKDSPCKTSHRCEVIMNTYLEPTHQCVCKIGDGFKENDFNECVDVDECKPTDPCPATSDCANTIGSYDCKSQQDGYKYVKPTSDMPWKLVDIDECVEGDSNRWFYDLLWGEYVTYPACGPGTTCTNLEPFYTCAYNCKAGQLEDKDKYYACIDRPVLNIDSYDSKTTTAGITITGDELTLRFNVGAELVNMSRTNNGYASPIWRPITINVPKYTQLQLGEHLTIKNPSIGVHDKLWYFRFDHVSSNSIDVEILYPSAPMVSVTPENGLCAGINVTLTCSTSNIGTMEIIFIKDGVDITRETTEGTHTLATLTAADAGMYTCVIIMNQRRSNQSNSWSLDIQDTESQVVAVEGLAVHGDVPFVDFTAELTEQLTSSYSSMTGFSRIDALHFRNDSNLTVYDVVFYKNTTLDVVSMDREIRQKAAGTISRFNVHYNEIRHRVRPVTPCLLVTPLDAVLTGGIEVQVTLQCGSNSSGFVRFLTKNGDIHIQEGNLFIIKNITGADSGSYSCGTVEDGLESALSTIVLNVKDIRPPTIYGYALAWYDWYGINCITSYSPPLKVDYLFTKDDSSFQNWGFYNNVYKTFYNEMEVGVEVTWSCRVLVDGMLSPPSTPVKFTPQPRDAGEFNIYPASSTVFSGARITLKCYTRYAHVTGYGTGYTNSMFLATSRSHTILKNGKAIVTANNNTEAKVVIKSANPSDSGIYTCVLSVRGTDSNGTKTSLKVKDMVFKRVAATVNLNISQWNDNLADYRTDEFNVKSVGLMTELKQYYKRFPGFKRMSNFSFRNVGDVEVMYNVEFGRTDRTFPDELTADIKDWLQNNERIKEFEFIRYDDILHEDTWSKPLHPIRDISQWIFAAYVTGGVFGGLIFLNCIRTCIICRSEWKCRSRPRKSKARARRAKVTSDGSVASPVTTTPPALTSGAHLLTDDESRAPPTAAVAAAPPVGDRPRVSPPGTAPRRRAPSASLATSAGTCTTTAVIEPRTTTERSGAATQSLGAGGPGEHTPGVGVGDLLRSLTESNISFMKSITESTQSTQESNRRMEESLNVLISISKATLERLPSAPTESQTSLGDDK